MMKSMGGKGGGAGGAPDMAKMQVGRCSWALDNSLAPFGKYYCAIELT